MRRVSLIIAFVGLNLMACCCGGCGSREETSKKIEAAHTLWSSGKKADAVGGYKEIFRNDSLLRWTDQAEKEKMLPRIVEFEVKAGNNHEAKIWIKRGLEGKLNAEYTNPTAKELFATVKNEHEAQLAAAKERREEAEREAKRLAAIEAAKPRPSRANYNKIQNGMSLAEAQQILGPGKEAAQAPGIQVVTWQSDDLLSTTIISITFENNQVQAKAIIGP